MLPITPALIERAAARLSAGGWRYTPRQLYYAACAEAETGRSNAAATGQIGLGVLMLLVAFILVRFAIPFTALLALGLILIVLGAVQRTRNTPLRGRLLALSFAEFIELSGERELPGMIRDDGAPEPERPGMRRIVLCDSAETVRIVNANSETAKLDGVVAVAGDAGVHPAHAGAVITLHDASPRGCALPLELADAALIVVDAGLRPSWVDSLEQQAVQGAPARMPRDLSPLLSPDEIAWLASGQRVELATLTPERILRLLKAAVDQAEADRNANPGVIELRLGADEISQIVAPHPRGVSGSAPARGFAAPGRGAFPSVQ